MAVLVFVGSIRESIRGIVESVIEDDHVPFLALLNPATEAVVAERGRGRAAVGRHAMHVGDARQFLAHECRIADRYGVAQEQHAGEFRIVGDGGVGIGRGCPRRSGFGVWNFARG